MRRQILPLDPARYQPHALHRGERSWAETNCYVDVWIELLHAWDFEPLAALAFTIAIDFEGDQWTFFKFPHRDLLELYGIDVQELAIWRPLVDHVEEQVGRGRPVLVELDSFYLPDTAGTTYRREHVKSTVAVIEIDAARRELGYFHGQGYYRLTGDDFAGALRLDSQEPAMLPPYVEFVKRRSGPLVGDALYERSLALLRRQVEQLPPENPFEQFKTRLAADLDWLCGAPLPTFHAYSFATLRQLGASYELASRYLSWLDEHQQLGLDQSIGAFANLSTGAKAFQFQLARAMARSKPLELAPLDEMAATWRTAADELRLSLLYCRPGAK